MKANVDGIRFNDFTAAYDGLVRDEERLLLESDSIDVVDVIHKQQNALKGKTLALEIRRTSQGLLVVEIIFIVASRVVIELIQEEF
ncbi:hypothetical protein V6N12_009122 [Hibiscus sabdariffa]|uniref:RNase H type-1 domain-containing protein n=1 Tax=Hibiscus sabdariffa TaxID=183260 RepID=A0ABR2C4R3_9ROSI